MKNTVSFRSHDRSDIPLRVRWLNNESATQYAIDDPLHRTTEVEQIAWFDRYDSVKDKIFFTILVREIPAGFMGLSHITKEDASATVFILIGEDDERGKGVGGIALDHLIAEAKERGLRTLALHVDHRNIPAIRLYRSRGFEEEGKDDVFIVMRRKIS